jgi:hypothetical protein
MAGINLEEILSLPDAQLVHRYEVIIAAPTIVTDGEVRAMRVQCTQVTIPDRTIEVAEVAVAGFTVGYAGRNVVGKELQISFFENANSTVMTVLRKWEEACRDRYTGSGRVKAEYAGKLQVTIYGQTDQVTQEYTARNAWPTQIPGLPLDGSQTQVLTQQVTFRIDEFDSTLTGSFVGPPAPGG